MFEFGERIPLLLFLTVVCGRVLETQDQLLLFPKHKTKNAERGFAFPSNKTSLISRTQPRYSTEQQLREDTWCERLMATHLGHGSVSGGGRSTEVFGSMSLEPTAAAVVKRSTVRLIDEDFGTCN